jgi:DNA-binding transcriptional ArsR family regulator
VVERQAARLDAVFTALGHPVRRSIIRQLARGEASVSELARPLEMSLNAIAKHLAVLTAAGLIEDRKEGRTRRCQLVLGPLRVAQAWLIDYGDFWEDQFDSLAAHLGGPAQD